MIGAVDPGPWFVPLGAAFGTLATLLSVLVAKRTGERSAAVNEWTLRFQMFQDQLDRKDRELERKDARIARLEERLDLVTSLVRKEIEEVADDMSEDT